MLDAALAEATPTTSSAAAASSGKSGRVRGFRRGRVRISMAAPVPSNGRGANFFHTRWRAQ
jgi:hypothetical protein